MNNMNNTISEVLEFVSENDVKFIRLQFCDILGNHKNISIMAEELPFAFENGISFDAHAIRGFREVTHSDLVLFPDPSTIALLPWRPSGGRVARFYCNIKTPNGEDFFEDGRMLLKRTVDKAKEYGYLIKIGIECEFYLFKTDETTQKATTIPLDNGGYLDIYPLDKGEDIRREICLTLEELGLYPESSHHEQGPGQNEIDFKFSDALSCADNLLTFKSVVSTIAARNGLYANFAPKPLIGKPGNGMHINLSIYKNGENLFKNIGKGKSPTAESFIAGVLAKIPEITVFLNASENSYKRFGEFEAPLYISWSHQNRSQLIRIPAAKGNKARMELRSPDSEVNPYLAFSLIISAGLFGISENLSLQSAIDEDLFKADKNITELLTPLPKTLTEALKISENCTFIKKVLGEELCQKYFAAIKKSVNN